MNSNLERRGSGLPRFRLNRPAVLLRLAHVNMTIGDLAVQTGIDAAYMSALLTGRHCPGARTRAKLMAATPLAQCSFNDLFVQVSGGAG